MEKSIKLYRYHSSGILKAPKNSGKKNKEISLYKLDLHAMEDAWAGYDLPKQYLKVLDEAVFALDRKTLGVLEYLLGEAPVQGNLFLYQSFDTSVRETLTSIGSTFLDKAVYLLCDNLYDEKTQYYSRDTEINKFTLKKLILYKYWNGRTGRGNQFSIAGFTEIQPKYYFQAASGEYSIAKEIKYFEAYQESQIAEGNEIIFTKEEGSNVIEDTSLHYNVYFVTFKFSAGASNQELSRKYRVICLNEMHAKNIAKNSFYDSFPGKTIDHVYDRVKQVDIREIQIEKMRTKAEKASVSLYDEKQGGIVWISEF